MEFISVIVVGQLVRSVCLAAKRIVSRWKYEKFMDTVPIGDTEFYEPKVPLTDWKTTIFFPAHLLIVAWMMITKTINSRLYY